MILFQNICLLEASEPKKINKLHVYVSSKNKSEGNKNPEKFQHICVKQEKTKCGGLLIKESFSLKIVEDRQFLRGNLLQVSNLEHILS